MEALILNQTIYPKPSLRKAFFFGPPLLHCSFSNPGFHGSYLKRSLSFTATCRLKTPQGNKKNDGNIAKKIILSEEVPPPLVEEEGGAENGSEEVARKTGKMNGVMGLVKRFPRKVLAVLSYLPLAIGEMFAIAALMAVGMFFGF